MSEAVGSVDALADELIAVSFEQEPLSPTLYGLDGDHDRLADLSAGADARYRARYADLAERATALDAESLSPRDRTTRAVVIQQAQARMDSIDARLVEHTVTDLFIAPAAQLLNILPMIGIATAEQADAYVARLGAIPAHLEQAAERHREGVAAGRPPVAHLVEAAIKHADRYLADPDADPLTRPQPPDGVSEGFAERRDAVLADAVRPAFARYRDVLADEILAHSRPADRPGLRWLPGGDEDYARMVRVHTATERTPDELHQTGLSIIDALDDEYRALGGKALGTTDLDEIFRLMRQDEKLRWTSEEELLDSARAAIERAVEAAPDWFGTVPEEKCEVRAVPANEAAGAPAAYYVMPSMDGARPGVYFANTYQVTERFRHQSESTAFHEAVPGHHFQLSLAQHLTDLPLLRRIADVNSYTEGWGLYTERLADEMGLYSDDVARLGMLTADSMRAGRLVVDTGLHAKGWSREQAVRFLAERTPMARVEIEAEVDRYIAFPGQALSYMVGRLEIQRVRAEAERALGDRFDIRAFHDVVLTQGPLPLSVLDVVVSEWAVDRSSE